jgi:hypothetical protein
VHVVLKASSKIVAKVANQPISHKIVDSVDNGTVFLSTGSNYISAKTLFFENLGYGEGINGFFAI